ncbi:MAG: phosphoribosyltransferase [Flavobacteriales bacterium]|nr:phosphoribosyltransferase [Flavobacteriales bacterium]
MEGKSFQQVMDKFRQLIIYEEFDMIVAIANGGIVPAGILCRKLDLPVYMLRLHLRDENNNKIFDKPQLLKEIDFPVKGKRILLVDDRIKTGTSIEFAKELLSEAALVKTFAVNGTADYALYDEMCFPFPWKL